MSPLKMMLFTNHPEIAATADQCGVDRIVVDLEIIGKNDRQGNLNMRISAHELSDVAKIRAVVHQAELLVRINPIHDGSAAEIEAVIAAGADILMLPFFNTLAEINTFLALVNQRAKTCLLLETAAAEALIDQILDRGGFDMLHIGINDLALSKGLNFLFASLLEPSFEPLCRKIHAHGIPFGFGGITRLNEGLIPAWLVIPEHYRLGSSQIILGRSFLSAQEIEQLESAKQLLVQAVRDVRDFEQTLTNWTPEQFDTNRDRLHEKIREVVKQRSSRA